MTDLSQSARAGFAAGAIGRLRAWLGACLSRHGERKALGELDNHLLRDIGVTRAQARREAMRPPWDGGCRQS